MIVTCTRCQARFRVPDEKVGARGARIRCARCQTLFTVGPPPVGELPAPAGAVEAPANVVAALPDVELEAPAREARREVAADDPFAGFRLDAGPPFGPPRDGAGDAGDPFGASRGPGAAGDPFAAGGTAQVASLERPLDDPGLGWDDAPPAGAGEAGAIAPGTELDWADDPFAAAISPRAERVSLAERSLPLTDLADLVGEVPRPPALPPPLPSLRAGTAELSVPEAGGGPDLALEEPTSSAHAALRAPPDDFFGAAFPTREDGFDEGPSELGAPAARSGEEPLALATEPVPTGLPEVWRTSPAFPQAPEEPEAPVAAPPRPGGAGAGGAAGEAGGAKPAGAGRGALRSIAVNAVSLAALLVVALAFRVLWRGDGAVGAAASPGGVLRAIGLGARPSAPLETTGVTSGRYPRAAGAPLLLVRGEVISRSPAPIARVRVDVEVVRAGRVLAHGSALAGAVPTPEELHGVRDAGGLDALSRAVAARARSVPPGAPVPFLAAFADLPEDLTGASLRVVASPLR